MALSLDAVSIRVQGVEVYRGVPGRFSAAEVSAKMAAETLEIRIDLAVGTGSGRAWGCDLSAAYVRINADYHT